MAGKCNLGNITDSLIRKMIVCETWDSHMRECLFRETDLTLDKCMQIGGAAELSRQRAKAIEVKSAPIVHIVSQKHT